MTVTPTNGASIAAAISLQFWSEDYSFVFAVQASSSIDCMGQQPGLAVEHPTFAFHPKITPETVSEGQKSPKKNWCAS